MCIFTLLIAFARLLEARKQDTTEADMPQLLHLAFITNKYKFSTTEKWVTDIILHHCRNTPGRLNFAFTCTPECLELLFDIAVRCDQNELREEVETKCLERFKAGELSAAFVLDLGERLQLRSFLGNAYYAHLMKLCSSSKRSPDEVAPPIPVGRAVARSMSIDTADLAPIHSQRLYAGFISLSYCWDSLTVIQVPTEGKKRPSGGCSMHDSWSCSTEDCWRTLFGQAALAKPLPDVLARLGLIGHKSRKTKTPCVASIPDIADGLYWRVSDELPDHFNVTYGEGTSDPTDESSTGSSESTVRVFVLFCCVKAHHVGFSKSICRLYYY